MTEKRTPRVLRIDPELRPRSLRQGGDELAARTYRAPRSVEDVTLSSEHTPEGERRREEAPPKTSAARKRAVAGRPTPAKRPTSSKRSTPAPKQGKAPVRSKETGRATPSTPRRSTPARSGSTGSTGSAKDRTSRRFAFEDAAKRVLEADHRELVATARAMLAGTGTGVEDEDDLTERLVEHYGTDPSLVAKLRLARVAAEVLGSAPPPRPGGSSASAGAARTAPSRRPEPDPAVRELLQVPFDLLVRAAALVIEESGATNTAGVTSRLVARYGTGDDPRARRRLAEAAQVALGQRAPARHRGRYGSGGSSGASSTPGSTSPRQESGCASAAVVIAGVLMALSVLLF